MNTGRSIAIFGTASDVGKSVTVTALCRIFCDNGLNVAPFKAQNMSNNSFVSLGQGELARAQAIQAEAARIEPTVDMNPILLKPASDLVAQVILRGQVVGNQTASSYFQDTSVFSQEAKVSLNRLRTAYDLVVIEGAGSCAEVNLRSRDFTNFEMAHHVDAPVILVADIDRGGVFAQVIGTLDVLDQRDRERVKGIIINRFRGDPKLFDEGLRYIEQKTKLPVLGLVPHYSDIHIDSEDGLPRSARVDPKNPLDSSLINIAVILLPHISNFTDFFPLDIPELTEVHYLRRTRPLGDYDLVLIPGSKSVRSDLDWLHQSGWSEAIHKYRATGGQLGGICGGYQMLGDAIYDSHGIEGAPGSSEGLKMLPVETQLYASKQLHRTHAVWTPTGDTVSGYEIHHGLTTKSHNVLPLLRVLRRNGIEEQNKDDGAMSADGKVWGCYLHGLFDGPSFRLNLLKNISKKPLSSALGTCESQYDYRQHQYNRLADHFRRHLNIEKLSSLVFGPPTQGQANTFE